MENFLASLPLVAKLAPDDYVGFTFFVGCMAMMAEQFRQKMEDLTPGFRINYFYCCCTLLVHARLLGCF
jgi:hypothetical protein